MKYRLAVTAVAALVTTVLAGASSAQALASYTAGGTCKVSPNWTIGLSANWSNTFSTSTPRGRLNYIVMSSPGELAVGTRTATRSDSIADVQYYGMAGVRFPTVGVDMWYFDKFENGKYFYRMDIPYEDDVTVSKVTIDPMTKASRTRCSATSSAVTLVPKV